MQLDGTNRGPIVFKALSVEVNEFLLEMCILLHLIIGLFVHSKSESVKHFWTVLAADRRSRGKRPGNARNRSAIYRNSKTIC